MIDFELGLHNLVRQDSTKVKLKGSEVKVEYRLHKDEFRDPKDPEGDSITLYCLHLPQISQTYIDEQEEHVFEALHEFFEEDFIRYYAHRLIEERDKDDEGNK